MKKFYIILGAGALVILGISILLLPNKEQLSFMTAQRAKKQPVSQQKILEDQERMLQAKLDKIGLDAQTVSDLADNYIAQGKVEKAIAIMERYHAKNPTDVRMLDKLGVIYHMASQEDNYIKILEEENDLAPSVNTSYTLQARYSKLYGTTRPEKTVHVIRQLIALQPDNIQNYKNLVYFLLLANRGPEAVAAIKEFKARFPDKMDYNFTYSLVDQLIKEGQYQEAYQDILNWIGQHPDSSVTNMATMYFNAHRPDYTLKVIAEKKGTLMGDSLLYMLYVKATLATRTYEALPLAQQWMQAHPDDLKMLEDFGTVFFAEKRYGDILKLFAPFKSKLADDKRLHDIYREALMATLKSMLASNPKDAVKLASSLVKDNPQDREMMEDLGNLFIGEKRYNETVQLFAPYQKQVDADPKLQDIYTQSLIASIKTHPENKPKLIALYEKRLDDAHTPPAVKKAILYGLMDLGAGKAALPYAEKFAYALRGDWVFLYEAFLRQLHETKELAAFHRKYTHSGHLTDKERNYFAADYLQEGNKAEAERLLGELAANKPASSPEVQTLVYLWGINPTPEQLDWLEQRAARAKDGDQIGWLQLLINVRAYDRVVKVASATPRQQRPIKLEKLYIGALQMEKDKQALLAELTADMQDTQAKDLLEYFSAIAMQQGFFTLAATGYDKLLAVDATNPKYLRDRGLAAYYFGKPETAEMYLGHYYQLGGIEPHALFDYAEILHQHDAARAMPVYEDILKTLSDPHDLSLDERLLKAHVLARLYRTSDANQEMAALAAQYPNNPQVKTDYAEFLLDNKQYAQAEQELQATREAVPAGENSELWRISRDHLARIEHTQYAYELLLAYDRAAAQVPEVTRLQHYHPDWIKAVYPGYDTVLLIGRPDTQLSYSLEGGSAVIGEENAPATQANADHYLHIRHELLYARLEQETGRKQAALMRLSMLKQAYPQDIGVLTSYAVAQRDNGQRLAALDLATQAYLQDPENHWVNVLLADLRKPDRPYVRGDSQWIHLSGNDQFINSASGMVPVNRNAKLAASVENNTYRFKNFVRANGRVGSGSGNVQRGEIAGIYEFESGPVARTSLFVNPASVGLGETLSLHDAFGNLNVYGEYHRADWTFTERLPDDVTHDRVGALQRFTLAQDVSGYLGGGGTRYNQDHIDNVTNSLFLNGGIDAAASAFNSQWAHIPVVIGYGFDGEFVQSRKYGETPDGNAYRLYPLISREVHALTGTYRYAFSDTLTALASVGYAYDQISGNSGPSIAASLTKSWDNGLEAQLRASHGISFTQGGSGMTTVGGYLLYIY